MWSGSKVKEVSRNGGFCTFSVSVLKFQLFLNGAQKHTALPSPSPPTPTFESGAASPLPPAPTTPYGYWFRTLCQVGMWVFNATFNNIKFRGEQVYWWDRPEYRSYWSDDRYSPPSHWACSQSAVVCIKKTKTKKKQKKKQTNKTKQNKTKTNQKKKKKKKEKEGKKTKTNNKNISTTKTK